MFASILLHFIVAEQLPISRRRSAANTFMWSQIAKIQDFARAVGMGNGIPIKIAGNEKITKVNFELLQANLALLTVKPLPYAFFGFFYL